MADKNRAMLQACGVFLGIALEDSKPVLDEGGKLLHHTVLMQFGGQAPQGKQPMVIDAESKLKEITDGLD